ncbi:9544_t:CDS:2, partial [Acaulospora colombiana]
RDNERTRPSAVGSSEPVVANERCVLGVYVMPLEITVESIGPTPSS